MRHPYDVPGWGVGEVWARDGMVLQHELPSEGLRREHEAAAANGNGVAALLGATGTGAGKKAVATVAASVGPAEHTEPPPLSPNGGARRPVRTLPADPSHDRAAFVSELCRRFAAHLAGVTTTYGDIRLELEWATPLQLRFAAAARAIPWGEVVSYGELAALAGCPGAARAAGSFCADNRFSLIVPCHRVIAANGIGGYGSAGVGLKRRLLAVEGIHL